MRGPKRLYWVEVGKWTDPDPDGDPPPTWGGRRLKVYEKGGGIYNRRGFAVAKVKSLRRRGYAATLWTTSTQWVEERVDGEEPRTDN